MADLILFVCFSLVKMTSTQSSTTNVLVMLKRLVTVLREKQLESNIIVASIFCRRRTRRNWFTNFSLKIWCFEQGRKCYFLFLLILYRETLCQGWFHVNNDENLFLSHQFVSFWLAMGFQAVTASSLFRSVDRFSIISKHLIQSTYQ